MIAASDGLGCIGAANKRTFTDSGKASTKLPQFYTMNPVVGDLEAAR